jgi:hypothetical protein
LPAIRRVLRGVVRSGRYSFLTFCFAGFAAARTAFSGIKPNDYTDKNDKQNL